MTRRADPRQGRRGPPQALAATPRTARAATLITTRSRTMPADVDHEPRAPDPLPARGPARRCSHRHASGAGPRGRRTGCTAPGGSGWSAPAPACTRPSSAPRCSSDTGRAGPGGLRRCSSSTGRPWSGPQDGVIVITPHRRDRLRAGRARAWRSTPAWTSVMITQAGRRVPRRDRDRATKETSETYTVSYTTAVARARDARAGAGRRELLGRRHAGRVPDAVAAAIDEPGDRRDRPARAAARASSAPARRR